MLCNNTMEYTTYGCQSHGLLHADICTMASSTAYLVDRGGFCRWGRRNLRQLSALALGFRLSCFHLSSCARSCREGAFSLLI